MSESDKIIENLIRAEIRTRMHRLFSGHVPVDRLYDELSTCEPECLPAMLDAVVRMDTERADLPKQQLTLLWGLLKVKRVEFVPDEAVVEKN